MEYNQIILQNYALKPTYFTTSEWRMLPELIDFVLSDDDSQSNHLYEKYHMSRYGLKNLTRDNLRVEYVEKGKMYEILRDSTNREYFQYVNFYPVDDE